MDIILLCYYDLTTEVEVLAYVETLCGHLYYYGLDLMMLNFQIHPKIVSF